MFHVSLPKKVVGSNMLAIPLLAMVAANLSYVLQLVEVLGFRKSLTDDKILAVLIRWENRLLIDATWELLTLLRGNFATSTLRTKWLFWERVMIDPSDEGVHAKA